MELSPTAYVILGTLGMRPMSGYDIKGLVDNSTRFFWAASYGQIYPELRRLKAAGLIEGTAEPESGRGRTVYRLTAEGRARLREWLAEEPEAFEMRDEALLKLFFAAASGGRDAPGALAAKRARHEEIVARLRELEPKVADGDRSFQHLVLTYGIECNEWAAQWCERALKALGDEEERAA
jgi:PadR family transcriptional regulator, regulatory protein AphA